MVTGADWRATGAHGVVVTAATPSEGGQSQESESWLAIGAGVASSPAPRSDQVVYAVTPRQALRSVSLTVTGVYV